MYLSLLVSLLAALIAMLLKQRFNWYLLPTSGSMVERCRDRQRRYDGLQKLTFRLFDRLLPGMLGLSPLYLVCGFCIRMFYTDLPLAILLTVFSVSGFTFFLWVIANTNPDEPPPPTLLPTAQRTLWKKSRFLAPLCGLWRGILSKMFRSTLRPPQTPPLPTIQGISPNSRDISPWLTSAALTTFQKTNAGDVRCVSWILEEITDSMALDAAIRLAGTIHWFNDEPDAEPPYDLIVSVLQACFDSTGKAYPGSKDRAYYAAKAILWTHICARCLPEESALRFPLPTISYDATSLGHDLSHLLRIFSGQSTREILTHMYHFDPESTPAYLQWTSNALLHMSWAEQWVPAAPDLIVEHDAVGGWSTIPLNAALDRLLTWCIFLDWPIDKSVLRVQDKSCVISCFRSPGRSHCRQWPFGTDHI